MIKLLSFLGGATSALWFSSEGGYEPIITFFTSLSGLLAAAISDSNKHQFSPDPRVEINSVYCKGCGVRSKPSTNSSSLGDHTFVPDEQPIYCRACGAISGQQDGCIDYCDIEGSHTFVPWVTRLFIVEVVMRYQEKAPAAKGTTWGIRSSAAKKDY